DTRGVKVVIFVEPGFPSVDVEPLDVDQLRTSLAGFQVVAAARGDLERELTAGEAVRSTVFVNPYGSAFPKEGWTALRRFLMAGGHWVNVGGVPLAVPVVHESAGWRQEVRQ